MEVEVMYLDVPLTVKGEWIHPEDCVLNYGDGSGYPGSGVDVEIDDILIGEISIIGMLLYKQIDEIKELTLEKYN